MTRRIDIGGNQGRGNPAVGHELDDDGYLTELGPRHWRAAVFWAIWAWALVAVLVSLAAFVLPDLLTHLLSLVIDT